MDGKMKSVSILMPIRNTWAVLHGYQNAEQLRNILMPDARDIEDMCNKLKRAYPTMMNHLTVRVDLIPS